MTQKEIAQQLKISQTTVSLALRGRGRMSQKLRTTIQNLAKKEMYTPNVAGQLLRQGKSNLIGVIFNARFEEFYAELHAELTKIFQQRGYLLLTLYIKEASDIKECFDFFAAYNVSGVITFANFAKIENFSQYANNTAVVLLEADLEDEDQITLQNPVVRSDFFTAGYQIGKHFIAAGCENLAFLGEENFSGSRCKGFIKAATEANLIVTLLDQKVHTPNNAGIAIRELLAKNPHVDGIFCHNDISAIAAIQELQYQGKDVPKDIKVAGFDDIHMAEFVTPSLTTIRRSFIDIANKAVELLINKINDCNYIDSAIIPFQLIKRNSSL